MSCTCSMPWTSPKDVRASHASLLAVCKPFIPLQATAEAKAQADAKAEATAKAAAEVKTAANSGNIAEAKAKADAVAKTSGEATTAAATAEVNDTGARRARWGGGGVTP